MKKHQIIPRRFRPQLFSEVVGQDHVVITIKNALRAQRFGHAYLFSGSRGTGKTTLARIFSKAMNCSQRTSEQEPCNQCDSCKTIDSGRSLDVLELDAASNRGIDDIRKINDTVAYTSCSGGTKVYIIDEVHMLTKEAFNAFLKTLEEPPEKVIFLLATTETQKIPLTVLSRCQKFSLHKLSPLLIETKLQRINEEEGLQVSPEIISLIANHAEGSLRDAEILLEQISLSEKDEKEELLALVGYKNIEKLLELDEAITKKDFSKSLRIGKFFFTTGVDLPSLLLEMLEHFHTHLCLTLQLPVANLAPLWEPLYKKNNQKYTTEQVLQMIDLLIQQQLVQTQIYTAIHFEILMSQLTRSYHKDQFNDAHTHTHQETIDTSHRESPPKTVPRQQPPLATTTTTDTQGAVLTSPRQRPRSRLSDTLKIREMQKKGPAPITTLPSENFVKPSTDEGSLFSSKPPQNMPPSSIGERTPTIQEQDLQKIAQCHEDQENTLQKQTKAYNDTVLQFAAVELEGSVSKGEDYG